LTDSACDSSASAWPNRAYVHAVFERAEGAIDASGGYVAESLRSLRDGRRALHATCTGASVLLRPGNHVFAPDAEAD
jgi:hypothetical protein